MEWWSGLTNFPPRQHDLTGSRRDDSSPSTFTPRAYCHASQQRHPDAEPAVAAVHHPKVECGARRWLAANGCSIVVSCFSCDYRLKRVDRAVRGDGVCPVIRLRGHSGGLVWDCNRDSAAAVSTAERPQVPRIGRAKMFRSPLTTGTLCHP